MPSLLLLASSAVAAEPYPYVVISYAQKTFRLQESASQVQVFPVGVGRRCLGCPQPPLGTYHTGADPNDEELYLPARREPAFHRGLPFVRLLGPHADKGDDASLAIHGPVTPTLIWGEVSAGCIRLRAKDLRAFFAVARHHPSLPVTLVRGVDASAVKVIAARQEQAAADCPESALGVRRLRRLALGQPVQDRLCGGVDHWYAIELSAGDQLTVRLSHAGGLRLELYGIRGISPVGKARSALDYRVPSVARNRGDRYLRITPAAGSAGTQSYSLMAQIVGGPATH